MGILLCEQNYRDVWRRNKSVRAEICQILRTHTHAAKLVVEIHTLEHQLSPLTSIVQDCQEANGMACSEYVQYKWVVCCDQAIVVLWRCTVQHDSFVTKGGVSNFQKKKSNS